MRGALVKMVKSEKNGKN